MGPKQIIARLADRLVPGSVIRYYLYRKHRRYEPELWLVPEFVDRNSIAIDVGGNAGIWCLQMARYAGHVHTFEPNPLCIRDLERLLPRRVTLHRLALSDKASTGQLRYDPSNTGIGTIDVNNTLSENSGIKTIEEVEVPTRTLDEFDLRNVALMKVDVEGHEEAVLAGAERLIDREHPVIICEIEERHNPGGFARVREKLERNGYRTCVIAPHLRPLDEVAHCVPIASHLGINNFVFVPSEDSRRPHSSPRTSPLPTGRRSSATPR